MASVQDRKPPSAGTKVSPGQDAPVTREGAGFVAPESLAAASYREDGDFGANRSPKPDQGSSQSGMESSNYTTSSGAKLGSAAQKSSSKGGTAPGYVANQHHSNNGPHGKKSTEGGFEDSRLKDGLQMALNSEPGSTNDPSRLAEAQFMQGEAAQPGVTGHREGSLNTKTAYENLDRETSS
ncbi:hypothetical protein HRG_006190 [Hirsutella rhossiliensis]|uniref:Uncharacterized protein n=1 Tax=Hirsutella rhossiliensis TaxID=111463 RepID=A0A9P8SJG2_9HYPO|nr:uncharacterized protein HRG_06190 [Hirsutella rhossiliensis]KAH0963680.1 hypothetical protein HRG_06190 [Hirsutella rhossiliensis]